MIEYDKKNATFRKLVQDINYANAEDVESALITFRNNCPVRFVAFAKENFQGTKYWNWEIYVRIPAGEIMLIKFDNSEMAFDAVNLLNEI